MDITLPLDLLGGLTPRQFMRRHWQKKPLLVRQAVSDGQFSLSRAELFKLAAREHVESRLIQHAASGWQMKSGPFSARRLPALTEPAWSLLVQGVDLHDSRAHALLQAFRFVPDARLDDVMVSFATAGGGVGPHFDSYDVFLLQASGRRRWKIGKQKDRTLQSGVPLKILQHFTPSEEFVLDAGDMLYLPPGYAHDGVALAAPSLPGEAGHCMTYSIGFKSPARGELAAELLQRLADYGVDSGEIGEGKGEGKSRGQGASPRKKNGLYRDPAQAATCTPAALPQALETFARQAVKAALADPRALPCMLGELLTEPKPSVWFERPNATQKLQEGQGLALNASTRMMYDEKHIFINGESYRAKGSSANLMKLLANQRGLSVRQLRKASSSALELLQDWHEAGWLSAASTPSISSQFDSPC